MLWDPLNWWMEKLLGKHIQSGFFAGLWNQHLRLYNQDQIVKALKSAGFEVINVRCLTWWCLPFNHYLVNIVARLLASGKLSAEMSSSLSKYRSGSKQKPIISLAFKLVNVFDRLNDVYSPKGRGVSIFVKAINPHEKN